MLLLPVAVGGGAAEEIEEEEEGGALFVSSSFFVCSELVDGRLVVAFAESNSKRVGVAASVS